MIAFVSLGLWSAAMVLLAPSAWRYIRGPYNLVDSYRLALFFAALLWTLGLGRLVFLPLAEDLRTAILSMSCALAGYFIVLALTGAKR